jgi:hypothetical protein
MSHSKFPNSKHIIKEAFEVGGVKYYEFDTTANMPWKRGLKCLSIYNELDMRCDRFYLTKHTEAMDNIFKSGKLGFDEMMKIRQLENQLKERLTMIFHEDLVYKVASVVFFDENENPDDWEWKYALEKIKHWKKHEGAHDFFLREPISRLIPFLNSAGENLKPYSIAAKRVDEAHLAKIYEMLLPNQRTEFAEPMHRYFWTEMNQDSAK